MEHKKKTCIEREETGRTVDVHDTDEISILDILHVLLKRWKMLLKVPLFVALVTALYTLTMPNQYTATALILPSEDSKGLMSSMMAQFGGMAGLAGGALGGGGSKAELYVTMLKSETIKDRIIDTHKLMEIFKANKRSTAYQALGGMTQVNTGKKDGVLSVAVTYKDPHLAATLANSYVTELGGMATSIEMTGAGNNKIFLEKRIAEAKGDLYKAEENLKNFQAKNKLVSVPEQAKATIEGVAQLRARLASEEVRLGALQRQFTDQSQEVKAAKSIVTQLRSQINALEGKSGSSLPGLGSVPSLGQEYMRLMREFKVQEAIFELLTKQFEMTKISAVKDVSPFQVIQQARVPEVKTKPKRSQIVILAGITSGLLMVLLAFIMEALSKMSAEDRDRFNTITAMLPTIPERVKALCTKIWSYLS